MRSECKAWKKTINRTLRLTRAITLTQLEANPPEPSVDFFGTSETSENPQKDYISLFQILKVRTSPNTLNNRIFELDWELILISLPAFSPMFPKFEK